MRIKETKFLGRKFYVVQQDGCYIFQDDVVGIIAVACKCTNRNIHPDNEEYFTIYTGNGYCIGGALTESNIQTKVQSYISKLPYFKKLKCYFIERRAYRLDKWEIFMQIEDENKRRIY